MTRIIVEIEGGLVQAIWTETSPRPMRIVIP